MKSPLCRHARACRGHPRLSCGPLPTLPRRRGRVGKTWMAGTSPAMTLPNKRVRGSLGDRRAAHVAHMVRRRERCGAMHGAAVVPDHEVADLPFVAVDKLRLRCKFDQFGEQR